MRLRPADRDSDLPRLAMVLVRLFRYHCLSLGLMLMSPKCKGVVRKRSGTKNKKSNNTTTTQRQLITQPEQQKHNPSQAFTFSITTPERQKDQQPFSIFKASIDPMTITKSYRHMSIVSKLLLFSRQYLIKYFAILGFRTRGYITHRRLQECLFCSLRQCTKFALNLSCGWRLELFCSCSHCCQFIQLNS